MAVPLSAARGDLASVHALPFPGDDVALVAGLRTGSPAAMSALCDRYSAHALRVLARILGDDGELDDHLQDVLLRVVRSAADVEDPSALKGWVSIVAVNVARTALKRRAMRRWLTLRPFDELPEIAGPSSTEEDILALRRTYTLLARLGVDDRIAFTLRFIEGMELTEVAAACRVSLATTKRRIARAEERFASMARLDPVLAAWMEGGSRWGAR